jgi:hypothetical protein
MGRRLGDLLVEAGRVGAEELAQALRAQRVSGGTLGTHLVRLGHLTEDELGDALAQLYGVPRATRAELLGAPDRLIEALSPEFARRHAAVPFRDDGGALHVAFGDPTDLLALQEAAFLAGRRIVPHAAPEFLLHEALGHQLGDGDPLLHRPGDDPPAPAETAVPAPVPPPEEPSGLARLGSRLARASDRDEVLEAALETLSGHVTRGALFALRADRAVLWRSCGFATPPAPASLEVSLSGSGVLAGLREGEGLTTGPLHPSDEDAPLARLFPDATLARVLVLPVYVKQHPVAVFLGDLSGISSPDLTEISLAASLTATALEVVILRQKILRASGAASSAPGSDASQR